MNDFNALTKNTEEKEFTVEREFAAPPDLMFQVFTQPEHLTQWWAPKPFTISACTVDLRSGGIWHYAMRLPEGVDHWARSVYREILPPEKLVYTSTFADKDANPVGGLPENTTTLIFRDGKNGKTRVTALIQFSNPEDMGTAIKMGMREGTNMTWDALMRYVQELQTK